MKDSILIYNPKQLNKEKFTKFFCDKMKNNGYVISDSNEYDISYTLRFADDCKWVSITSDLSQEEVVKIQDEAGKIAKILKKQCIISTVIDSDCAMIELYGTNGKKTDSIIMGRADDYFNGEIPQPSEKNWTELLSNGSSWNQVKEIINGDFVFVEEGLEKLSVLIGIEKIVNSDNMEEKSIVINFQECATAKEKKLTLKTAFIKVFGDALEPLGYKKIKGANPYFVRVIGDEIIHVITFVTDSTAPGYKAFVICGDVRSIYASNNYFSKKPEDAYRESYFDLSNFRVYSYRLHHEDYDFDYQREISRFLCKDDNASIMSKMYEALDTSQKILLPFIDSINNIDELYKYLLQYHPSKLDNRKELLHLKVDKYAEYINNLNIIRKEIYRKCVELHREGYTKEKFEKRLDRAKVVYPNRINDVAKIWKMPELYTEYKKEEEDAKEKTIIALKECGII